MDDSEKEKDDAGYDVDEDTFAVCVKVGKQLATDKDYFEICVSKALEQAGKENTVFTTA
jgi:hypothetical protein|tara:strand:+ start:126 stop:302 length:177 start_codon:yes stop_codon:yes gene_type:complete